METSLYILAAFALIALNAFFVLAEFAIVKIRPTQVEPKAAAGSRSAKRLLVILDRIDEYLSVCQVGITLASIGLGFVGEPAFAVLVEPILHAFGVHSELTLEAVSITISFLAVSYLHIVLGELIPKTVAIRNTERAVEFIILPIIFFRWLFIAPIWILNHTVNILLKPFKLDPSNTHALHTEDEIRAILDQSEYSGVMSFRRLLYVENVFDFGTLTVRNAMKSRRETQSLRSDANPSEIDALIGTYRYSRYPIIGNDPDKPLGFIHVKDLYFAARSIVGLSPKADLPALLKPALTARESDPLEGLLAQMQKTGKHLALVYDTSNRWSGMITLEDVLEEIVGTIEEEYPVEPVITIADFLKPEHVVLDVPGGTLAAVIQNALNVIPKNDLPLGHEHVYKRIMERERQGGSFVGRHLSIPHGRLDGISKPMVIIARPAEALPAPAYAASQNGGDSIRMLFILLTPATSPRIHQLLLSHIAGIYESDFLEARLYEAETPEELHQVIVTAEQISLA